jgi:hypothetical protein
MIWLYISPWYSWFGNTIQNRTWYESLVNACNAESGVRCGI